MKEADDPRRHFADKVVRLQAERGLSNEELAARSKLDPSRLEAILGAEATIDVADVFLIAGALEVEPGRLLEGVEWIPGGAGGEGEYRFEDPDDD